MFSNKYIFIYTSVLVVAVAVILALAATLLQPMQTRNQDAAKMQEILKAAGRTVEREEAVDLYPQVIAGELTVDRSGRIVESERGCAFKSSMKVQLGKAAKHEADASAEDGLFPVFVCKDSLYIVPLQGNGLWGPIWGYLALEKDFNTIAGVSFGHQGETPGLGAEITSDKFQSNFKGKKIFDPNGGFVSITAQKGGAEKFSGDISHAVDAVSGGTITSKGVTAMLFDCLKYYVPFFKKDMVVGEQAAEIDSVAEMPVPEPEPEPEPAPVPVVKKPVRKPAPVVDTPQVEPEPVVEPAPEPATEPQVEQPAGKPAPEEAVQPENTPAEAVAEPVAEPQPEPQPENASEEPAKPGKKKKNR